MIPCSEDPDFLYNLFIMQNFFNRFKNLRKTVILIAYRVWSNPKQKTFTLSFDDQNDAFLIGKFRQLLVDHQAVTKATFEMYTRQVYKVVDFKRGNNEVTGIRFSVKFNRDSYCLRQPHI